MHLFVAGTFDHFHDGHKYLLEETIKKGKKITIGITSDIFVKQYKPLNNGAIEQFARRKEKIEKFLDQQKHKTSFEIISIDDPYEPATSEEFDALIVTKHNRKTGEEINKKRKEKNLKELVLIEIPLLPAYDGLSISSTRIRSGEIDASGNLYLPDFLRSSLRNPLGEIISPEKLRKKIFGTIITVGDVTTDVFMGRGIVPDLAIIDLHARRKPYKLLEEFPFPEHIPIIRVTSGPGYISDEALVAIEDWREKGEKMVLLVKGEDDLLVLPTILAAPLNTLLYYGQPNEGMVEVHITESIKRVALDLLEKFERSA